ncbi:MAG: sulfite exporter TauE/SafE family protein [Candidatus Bipolaricaulota bacterium]|nr:sulfite exporter TauE/SafE family protein [Candidatus Bipolaricaulota bacterium]
MPTDIGTFLCLFFSAIVIGGFASLLGLGGGVFMVPLLSLAGFVATMPEAVGTSIAGVVFTSLSSSVAYVLKRKINFRLGFLLMPTTIFGAWCGARFTEFIDTRVLSIAFGVFLLYPALMMIQGKTPKEITFSLRGKVKGARLYGITAVVGLIAGIAAGLFGIGGGTVMVPSLSVFLGLDILTTIATSLFIMAPSAIMGSYQHWVQGNLHPELALPLILGIIIGAQIGPRVGSRLPKKRLRQIFGIILLYAAANMIIKGIF